ncbi:MAG: pyridine nucleotide-disulfide oxidoreductase [Sulfobacillus acidophilus]|uniref:Pyridine nucleotide-disulfide oxidoreductase n=1 Tax=Sulfobacillus acidophilus TaxID=53633 RepID=A0A2T2WIU8_9FIRM|nr:MAG: pyridine nucleotide-disulfide oxidoreductase [Sulfobacillus acidophilus]
MGKPHVVVLGANFAGLAAAQKIREFARDRVDITVIDRKTYLLFVPNIGLEVLEDRNPQETMWMPLIPAMKADNLTFVVGEVMSIDVDSQVVEFNPNERPGSAMSALHYDYLVVALGAKLAYDQIRGFDAFGHTVSDTFYGNRLRHYLFHEYRGGPVAVGSARFHQGTKTQHLIPAAVAACEGPPVEVTLSMGAWLKNHNFGGPEQVTVFTPGEWIAEDAGMGVVKTLLGRASSAGFHYLNNTYDIQEITGEGIEFVNGPSVEAELKIIFPDWQPHAFMKDLPISDEVGFVVTDMTMRNPDYPNVLACGDAAAVSVPKLGMLAHLGAEAVARQVAKDVGMMPASIADRPMEPIVNCIGDMGDNEAFYISSNTWYGGKREIFRTGRIPYLLKLQYKEMFFRNKGKVPDWGMPTADILAELLGKE